MGSRGPLPKPEGRRAGHRRRDPPQVGTGSPRARIPTPPHDLLPSTLKAWRVYWRSPSGHIAADVDLQAIRRLFIFYDRQTRALDLSTSAPLVKGSTGQLRLNPLADYALKLEGAICRLEAELGLTPAGRVRLGLPLDGQEDPTLAAMNRRILEEPPDEDEPDPRFTLLAAQRNMG